MWHRYAKCTIRWFCPSLSRFKDLRGKSQKDRRRTLGTMYACKEMWGGIHAHRASKLGPSNDSGIRMLNGKHNPKLHQSLEDGHTYCILLILVVFCYVSKILSLYWMFYVTMNIYLCFYFYTNIARDVVRLWLMFVDICHFHHTFSHAQIYAYTIKHTCMIRAQEKCLGAPETRTLEGAEEALVRDKAHTHTHVKFVLETKTQHTHTHTHTRTHTHTKWKKHTEISNRKILEQIEHY